MWNEAPCPKCKTVSFWSDWFKGFYCSSCGIKFEEPERRVNDTWPDDKIMAKSINILVERIDQILLRIDDIEKRILKLERPPVGVKMRDSYELQNDQ